MSWLSGWGKRIKITIDSGDVSSALTWFPVMLYISASSGINSQDISFVFDEVGDNSKKIAVTDDTGNNELHVEIDNWDYANKKVWLWVSKDGWSISDTVDTIFYLYYDNTHVDNTTYVGDPNSAVAENVWDINFVMVTHMQDNPDTSHVRDSTDNDNDGTKIVANQPLVNINCKIDSGQYFNGSTAYINCGNHVSFNISTGSWEAWLNFEEKPSDVSHLMNPLAKALQYWTHASSDDSIQAKIREGGTIYIAKSNANYIVVDTWYHVVGTYDGENLKLYIDGNIVDTNTNPSGNLDTSTAIFAIGTWSSPTDYFKGYIDEVRVSNTPRPVAWIKASYESESDNFLTFGREEVSEERILHLDPGPHLHSRIEVV